MQRLLEDIGFRDPARAMADLQAVERTMQPSVDARLPFLLASSPDPDAALQYLARMSQEQGDSFRELIDEAPALHYLITVASYSRFLAEEVLQHPEWIEELTESPDEMFRVRSTEEFTAALARWIGPAAGAAPARVLALFRRHELLRILLRDALGYATLSEVAEELSNLADAILDVAYRRIRAELVSRYGTPRFQNAAGESQECGFSVIALGKLGGRELNYSSDIDLMFIYGGNGQTDGASPISNKEFFKKLANHYTDLLSTYTSRGVCYRVDLRLRPDGRLGEVVVSLDGAKSYYQSRARDWELQMLIKARIAAGEPEPGCELLDAVEPRIYESTTNFSAVEAVSATRERIHEKAMARRGGSKDVKLTRGGIRDIEFLVQCLQRLHGGRESWVRHGGTLLALFRLRDKGMLSESEYSRLAGAYQFLRHLEHRLQFLEDRQTHVLPADAADLEVLARRMPASMLAGTLSADALRRELNRHLENVQETYERVIHSQQPLYYSQHPLYYSLVPGPSLDEVPAPDTLSPPAPAASNLIRFLDKTAPELSRQIAASPLRRGFRAFESFLENVMPDTSLLAALDTSPQLAQDVIDIFENSPHFAEELIRAPEFVNEIAQIRSAPGRNRPPGPADLETPQQLRRYFRREMLRIQSESICLARPIFETLGRTSDLADVVIAAAYRIAVQQVAGTSAAADPSSEPRDEMMVVALGRLGMREFDLGSDADLNFILPDSEAAELGFWTRVASRMIDVIAAYTGEGTMFTVDTRLRPNGREGPLVQLVGGYLDYFEHRAEAWEGITWMKSRAVAGRIDAATQFLTRLQEVDWRRYGQSGRSRDDLRQMRARLEHEQGEANPLKAGFGGYYDIDFALMYLRLRSAGIFFKVLNTPERIDVIERMGHLEREDAQLLTDAAILYRGIDHGLRVYSGHAEGRLPQSEVHLRTLTNLVRRWTPEHLHDQPLPVELAQIQAGTRACFRRLFG
ncbi:MAG TPA: glutamine-synthetase adenylyltransferase [Bryobacteraceae bacterium]|nr:glutamine-synthetase adenylyltransferase [Bryobacteraceae bacterium]